MNQKIIISLFLLSFSYIPFCLATNVTSQTFIFPRPLYNNLAAQNGPWLIFATETMTTWGASFQIVGAYQDSIQKNDRQGYFSIDCKKTLLVAGDTTVNAQRRDVRAEFLNLPSDFSGMLEISPEQKQRGFWITYFQRLGEFIDHSFFHHLAFVARIPYVVVENSLHLSQFSLSNPSPTPPHDIIDALNQQGLLFAKMFQGTKQKDGIAEIRFDVRTTFIDAYPFLLAGYSGFIIPTMRSVEPDFIFTPVVGINRHTAIVAGINVQFPLSDNTCPWLFTFFFDAENRYYIRSTQCRTFDLKRIIPHCRQKQWSRYLPVRREGEVETTFAANVLTLPVTVKPNNRANLEGGFRWYYRFLQAEVGYQLWVQGDERIELKQSDCENEPYHFESFGIAGTGTSSASQSTINNLAPNDPTFITINPNDLDLLSGSARGVSTNMVYGSISFTNTDEYAVIPFFIDVGTFYEATKNNAAFTNWGLWTKIGIQF